MSLLTQASLITTPTAYKTSKLYSIVPSSGNGDMTVVRNTTATRTNGSQVIESVGNNIPRLNYDANGSASILLEPQRTNLLLNSVWAGGGSLPTSWTISFSTGTSTPTTSIKNPNATAYKFVTSTQRQEIKQQFALVLNSITTFSVYVESVTTAILVNQMLRLSSVTGTGTDVFLKNNVVISGSTNIEAGNTYSLQFTCTTAGTFDTRVGSGVNGNITGDITISMPQFEQGAYSTSFIPTTTTALTRNADAVSKTAISDLIGQTEGVIFIESAALFNDLTQRVVSISDATSANRIGIYYNTTSNQILVFGGANGTPFANAVGYVLTDETQFAKIAVRYRVNDITLWVNGVKRGTDITSQALPINLSRLAFDSGGGGDSFYAKVKQLQLYKTYLTDAEMTSLTTL